MANLCGVIGRAAARGLLTLTMAAGIESSMGGRDYDTVFNDFRTRSLAGIYAAFVATVELQDKKERKYGKII